MSTRRFRPVALALALIAPTLLAAQQPLLPTSSVGAPAQVGGKSTVDLVTVRSGSPGVPLRNGAVIPGSERVQLGAKVLRRGVDYSLDAEAGVLYLMIAAKPGESVTVSYRYDSARSKAPVGSAFAGLRPFRFDLAPGRLGMVMGMGLTERTADGSVLTSNVYGWNNSFSLGQSQLKGIFLLGERTQEQASSIYEYQTPGAKPDDGRSRLMLQSLQGNLAGGSFELDYQDISKNFSAFSALSDGGYDAAAVDRLSKERGLTRMGLNLKGLKLGSLGFSQSFRTVEDGDAGLEWRSFGVDSGPVKLNWRSQKIDKNFTRFKDLGEAERDQLAKEVGLSRENWDGTWTSGLGAMSFNGFSIKNDEGKGVGRKEIKLDGSKLKFSLGEQSIETGFNRFDSLFEAERGQWGREVGLSRNWKSLEAPLFGASQPLRFKSHQVSSNAGAFNAIDASVGGKSWSLEHIARSVDTGFTSLANLTQEELDGHVNAISNMYAKGGVPFRAEERPWLLQGAGLSRSFTRLTATPFANWNLNLESLRYAGKTDDAGVDSFALNGGGSSLTYRRQTMGDRFTELTTLLELERNRLGTLSGLNRTDFGFNTKLPRGATFEFGQMDADTTAGGAARRSLKYSDRTMQVSANSREIDPGFSAINQILDPERDLLTQLVGFKEADAQIKWQVLPNLRLEAMGLRSSNSTLNQDRDASNLLLNWAPNRMTGFEYFRSDLNSNDPSSLLFANAVERMSLTRNLGKYGTIKFGQQIVDYGGSEATLPDSRQHSLAYETKIDSKTSLRTEQIRTQFANGDKEDVSANTISTEIGRSIGISLTDVSIDRGGVKDEHKSSIGGWIAFGNGLKLNVGLSAQGNHVGSSMSQNLVSLTPGSIGNLLVSSANYNANSWEQGDRVQAMSTIGLSTAKPFAFGFLKDIKLNYGLDTAADHGKWLKENRSMGFSGRIGSNNIGFEYRGQTDQLENRASDRTFSLSTDQSEKARFKASAFFKERSLPGGKDIAIRNFSLSAKPSNNLELSHQMITNPESPRGDLLLGSATQPLRANKWKLDYVGGPNLKLSGTWEEQRNDDNNALSRLGGLNLVLFEGSGSPLSLFYGVEELNGNVPRRTIDRWSLRYDQRPGPNQIFSLFMGNVTYGHTILPNEKRDNLTMQLEYQWRFK